MLKIKKTKNLEVEPLHPKNMLLASVVHGVSCLFDKKIVRGAFFQYPKSNLIANWFNVNV
jgi:hypothetical protein